MAMVQSEARIIVALNIGSDWSGFAYALKSRPEDITNNPHEWLSAIYYEPGDAATAKVKSWGYRPVARSDHEKTALGGALQRVLLKLKRQQPSEMSEVGTDFKSFLGASDSSMFLLQKGFTLTQVISDYLRLMGASIMSKLQRKYGNDESKPRRKYGNDGSKLQRKYRNEESKLQRKYGNDVSMNDVEWCVVLAHDWGDHAMELMKMSVERAGLVQSAISRGGSPHPLRFVPQLDAASYFCLREFGGSHIQASDKLLVADLGHKSGHITVQEVHSVERSKFEVKQVAESVGDLGGGKQWDKVFRELLIAKLLPAQDNVLKVYAFEQFIESHLEISWDRQFFTIEYNTTGYKFVLPIDAQNRWKQLDVEHGNPIRDSYDVIKFNRVAYETALFPYLDECVALISPHLLSTPDIKAILFVGELCNWDPSMRKITKDLNLCNCDPHIGKVTKDLNSSVKVVSVDYATSKGAVQMVLDQVLPFIWTRGGKLLNDGASTSSSHGNGISGQTSSPRGSCDVLPGTGSTNPSLESSNALGGGEALEPSLQKKPSDSQIEGVVKKYSWDEVLQMTNGLNSRMLGKGGFGTVYLGKFENGKKVAVKVLNESSQEGKLKTFVNEVNLLIQVNHVNLVKLLGYCQDKRNVVIYEYAEEGSIVDHLHGDKTRLSDWKQRLSIMFQAAYGLDYLHSQCSPTIIHRDIKSENILLTKNMVAKVGDFGISKLMGVDEKTHLTTKLIGSLWYIDPEYQETGQLRQSSDVYSFGIVLLEMISGQKPAGIGAWVNKIYGSGGGGAIKAIADSSFSGNYNPKAMKMVIKLAMSCIDRIGTSRPMMRQVVDELKKAQSIEEEKKKSWFKFSR